MALIIFSFFCIFSIMFVSSSDNFFISSSFISFGKVFLIIYFGFLFSFISPLKKSNLHQIYLKVHLFSSCSIFSLLNTSFFSAFIYSVSSFSLHKLCFCYMNLFLFLALFFLFFGIEFMIIEILICIKNYYICFIFVVQNKGGKLFL